MRTRAHLAVTVTLVVAGCSASGSSESTAGGFQLPGPGGQARQGEVVREELFAFADRVLAEMARIEEIPSLEGAAPVARAYVSSLQADVSSTALALAVEPDVESALLDLMASVTAKRLTVTMSESELPSGTVETLAKTLATLEDAIWDVATGVHTTDELTRLRDQVRSTWEGRSFAGGIVRVADLPGPSAVASKGLFSPITDATRQLEESRLLGERALFVLERLPAVAIWQAEATALELLASPDSRQALDGLSVIAGSMERLAARTDSMSYLLDAQREALLSSVDARTETMGSLVGAVGAIVEDASPLLDSGERLAELSLETTTSMREALTAIDALVETLRDDGAPGGAMSLDIARYEAALSDLADIAESLEAAAIGAEGAAEMPRHLVDHAAWRAAQLLLLLFGLLLAYRWITTRVLPPRES